MTRWRALRQLRWLLALLVVSCTFSERAWAKPPKRDPPLLFGGAIKKAKPKTPLDPRLPTGALVSGKVARPVALASRCSFLRPVCVHATTAMTPGLLPEALLALERAYERTVLALGLPPPNGDRDVGGSDALDWYLGAPGDELVAEQEPMLLGKMDSAAVFCRGGGAAGVLLDREASLCLGEALGSSIDAGEQPDARRALALELWWITGAKTALDVQAVDDAQRHPDAALARDGGSGGSERFALLLEMLETTRSASSPGKLAASMFWAAGSSTPPGAARHDNEPDVFDVLRHSLDEETTRYADLLVDFALRRSLTGDRDDGTRLPTLGWAGAFGRASYDWVIPFSSLPRRVLTGHPIAQSGSELIWIDLDKVSEGAALGFRAEWEVPVAFQWRMLLIDQQGREVRRMDVTFQERGSSAEGRLVRLDGGKAIILAGVNVGGVDLAHPFDPDVAPFEPSACTVYLIRL